MTKYTEEERSFMREYVPGHSHAEIRQEFKKRFGYIPCKTFPGSYIKNNGLSTGRTGYFQKGHVPFNKGKKMPKEVYKKCKRTMFKPGSLPATTDPVGTEKKLSDGYVWVKVNDLRKVKKKVNWKMKHRLLYEKHYGEIPDGYVVIFLDGDKDNFAISNLAAVSRNELVRLNQNGLIYDHSDLTRSGIEIARLMIKINERAKE